jgi:hypothetical protein
VKQVLDYVSFAARREHRHKRRVTHLQLGSQRPVLALVEFLAGLRVPGFGDVVGKELDLRVLGAQVVQRLVDLAVGLDALRVRDPLRSTRPLLKNSTVMRALRW